MSIFISHAEKDEKLVTAFVEMLRLGANISIEQIFCTSLEGMEIPEGQKFISFIKEQVENAKLVVIIITPSYYESVFCLCELGASWGLGKDVFPLLVPPFEHKDLRAVLRGTQAGHINDHTTLGNLRDRLGEHGLSSPKTNLWNKECAKFLKKFEDLQKNNELVPPSKVFYTEHQSLREQFDSVLEENIEKDKEIAELNDIIAQLKKCKDKNEVAAVVKKFSSVEEEFNSLVGNVQKVMKPLASIVQKVLFRHMKGEKYVLPPPFGNEDVHDEVQSYVDEGYLYRDDEGVDVNTQHHKISRAKDSLSVLEDFMVKIPEDSEFIEDFVAKKDYPFDFQNLDFWRAYLMK